MYYVISYSNSFLVPRRGERHEVKCSGRHLKVVPCSRTLKSAAFESKTDNQPCLRPPSPPPPPSLLLAPRHCHRRICFVTNKHKKGPLTEKAIKSGNYAAVLLVDEGIGFQLKINEACRRAGTAFVSASSRGAFASLFCDFGETFIVEDEDGEAAKVRANLCLFMSVQSEK